MDTFVGFFGDAFEEGEFDELLASGLAEEVFLDSSNDEEIASILEALL